MEEITNSVNLLELVKNNRNVVRKCVKKSFDVLDIINNYDLSSSCNSEVLNEHLKENINASSLALNSSIDVLTYAIKFKQEKKKLGIQLSKEITEAEEAEENLKNKIDVYIKETDEVIEAVNNLDEVIEKHDKIVEEAINKIDEMEKEKEEILGVILADVVIEGLEAVAAVNELEKVENIVNDIDVLTTSFKEAVIGDAIEKVTKEVSEYQEAKEQADEIMNIISDVIAQNEKELTNQISSAYNEVKENTVIFKKEQREADEAESDVLDAICVEIKECNDVEVVRKQMEEKSLEFKKLKNCVNETLKLYDIVVTNTQAALNIIYDII